MKRLYLKGVPSRGLYGIDTNQVMVVELFRNLGNEGKALAGFEPVLQTGLRPGSAALGQAIRL
jgi:hypothetical protein